MRGSPQLAGNKGQMDLQSCYHCGLRIPRHVTYLLEANADGNTPTLRFCCPGCRAVAQAIIDSGLRRFYEKRTGASQKVDTDHLKDLEAYEHVDIQSRFVRELNEHTREATLNISGITCGACLWLIESSIARIPGVESVTLNYSTRRAQVTWTPADTDLKSILAGFSRIGFKAYPYQQQKINAQIRSERDRQIRRIGISGVLGMQIMMLAVALYFGKSSGIARSYEHFFEWISLLLTLPIVFYCAQPFFAAAWRGVKHVQPGIDIPVALGIAIAFIASVWATVTTTGDTYFEAIAMFVFLLLSTRHFELIARERGLDAISHLRNALPLMANRIDAAGVVSRVPALRLQMGDRVLIGAGEGIPADGVVIDGVSSVDESVVSGESSPVPKRTGSEVIGGSVNVGPPLTVEVTRNHDRSVLGSIAMLAERAQSVKPRLVQQADRIAVWFVIGLMLTAVVVMLYCWWYAPQRLLSTVIAVLVIACPCALSLATPAALSASVGALTRRGIILFDSGCLEKLIRVTHTIFDKTGTLTEGELKLERVETWRDVSARSVISIAAALEAGSYAHPVARALRAEGTPEDRDKPVEHLRQSVGAGVSGTIAGKTYYFGSAEFVQNSTGHLLPADAVLDAGDQVGSMCLLADQYGVIGHFRFRDRLKRESKRVVRALKTEAMKVSLLSGDRLPSVQQVAESVAIDDHHAQLSPQQKLERVRDYQKDGNVLAVGDGVNDAPLLAAASVGVAMGSGADLTRITADVVLINNRLDDLILLLAQARKTRRVVLQNLVWAAGYNLLALPLGIMGVVPPWLAVIGMSASSLVVVLNALRLSPIRNPAQHHAADHNTQTWSYA